MDIKEESVYTERSECDVFREESGKEKGDK